MAETTDILPFLRSYLTQQAAVSSLLSISGSDPARYAIYPDTAPQSTRPPYAVYWQVSGPRVRHFEGAAGVSHPRVQIDCYGSTKAQSKAIARAIRDAIDLTGSYTMGDSTIGNVRVQFVEVGEIDEYDPPISGGEYGFFCTSLDVVIWFEETIT